MDDEWVNQSQLAALLRVCRSRVSTKLKNYLGARDAKGRVNKAEAMLFYENTTQQARRKRPRDES